MKYVDAPIEQQDKDAAAKIIYIGNPYDYVPFGYSAEAHRRDKVAVIVREARIYREALERLATVRYASEDWYGNSTGTSAIAEMNRIAQEALDKVNNVSIGK